MTMPAPPPYGRVVDGAVPVVGEVAQVVHPQVEQALLAGLADQREVERREVVREDRDDVEPQQACASRLVQVEQPGRRVDDDPAARDVDLGHDRRDERHQRLDGRRPARTTSRSWAGPVLQRR